MEKIKVNQNFGPAFQRNYFFLSHFKIIMKKYREEKIKLFQTVP